MVRQVSEPLLIRIFESAERTAEALLGAYLLGYVIYYLLFFVSALFCIVRHRLRLLSARHETDADVWLPPVSVIIPAHNEEKVICNSLRSVLRSRYPVFEVIVVSDGSTDRTLEVLREEFHLVRTTRPPLFKVPCRPTRAAFVSATEPRLLVVDKENGGRADALNAGLAFSR